MCVNGHMEKWWLISTVNIIDLRNTEGVSEVNRVSVRVFSESGKQVGKTHPDCEQHQLWNMEKQA